MNFFNVSTRVTNVRSDRMQPPLRPGDLVGLARRSLDDAVLRVDVNDGRLPVPRLDVVARLDEGRDDDHVARTGVVRGRAVDADDARIGRRLQRVSLQPAAVGAVPDVNLLVRHDVARAHQRRVDGHGAFIVQVRLRDRGAVNLRFEEGPAHQFPSVQAGCAGPGVVNARIRWKRTKSKRARPKRVLTCWTGYRTLTMACSAHSNTC